MIMTIKLHSIYTYHPDADKKIMQLKMKKGQIQESYNMQFVAMNRASVPWENYDETQKDLDIALENIEYQIQCYRQGFCKL